MADEDPIPPIEVEPEAEEPRRAARPRDARAPRRGAAARAQVRRPGAAQPRAARSSASTTRSSRRSGAWASSCTTRSASASPPRRSASCTACSSTASSPTRRWPRSSTRCSSGRARSKEALEEGCLSLPGVLVEVERPVHVRVRAQDEHGEPILVEASGLEARVHPARDGPPRRRADPRPHVARPAQAGDAHAARGGAGRAAQRGLSRRRAGQRCGRSTSAPRTSPPPCSSAWRTPRTGRRSSSRAPTRARGPRPEARAAAGGRARRARSGIEVIQPEDAARRPRCSSGSPPPSRRRSSCAPTAC